MTARHLLQKLVQFANRGLLCGLVIYGATAVFFIWRIHDYDSVIVAGDLKMPADGIVILTGGEDRVDRGITALRDGEAARALISGVHPSVTRNDLLTLHHVPPALGEKIDLGFGAIDTAGNAEETARWVEAHGMHSLIVVTSNYHMPRALLHLHVVLPTNVRLLPLVVTPDVLSQPNWYLHSRAWILLGLAYHKYLLTWPEILLWRYKR